MVRLQNAGARRTCILCPPQSSLWFSLLASRLINPWMQSFSNLWVTVSQAWRLPSRNQSSAFHLSVLGKKLAREDILNAHLARGEETHLNISVHKGSIHD